MAPELTLHWNHFLSLEKELDTVSQYIEFNEDNKKTYSTELVKLYLASCSEIDVICKMICAHLGDSDASNIKQYYKTIVKHAPNITSEEIFIPKFKMCCHPWQSWSNNPPQAPLWWTSHNKVKHQRNVYYSYANLDNVLSSLSGLMLILLYGSCIIKNNMVPLITICKIESHPLLLKFNINHYPSGADLGRHYF